MYAFLIAMAACVENISMIPDIRTYRVSDIPSRKDIGTLDEWFVAENAKLGDMSKVEQYGYPYFPITLLNQQRLLVSHLKKRLPSMLSPVITYGQSVTIAI
jgi:Lhr-like helicase